MIVITHHLPGRAPDARVMLDELDAWDAVDSLAADEWERHERAEAEAEAAAWADGWSDAEYEAWATEHAAWHDAGGW